MVGRGARPLVCRVVCAGVFGCGLVVRPCVCGVVVGSGSVVAGFVCERGASWHLGDVRQTRIMEQFTRCGSIALDSEALH